MPPISAVRSRSSNSFNHRFLTAANADFDKLAEEEYNKKARENGWERRYNDLSPSTRLKYYYQAQKNYEKRTGKPAYSQVKGNTTFQEYFEGQPESFKRSWLGPKRYDLYKQGKYDPLKLGNPDTGYKVPIADLEVKIRKEPANNNISSNQGGLPQIAEARKILSEIEQSDEIQKLDKQIDIAYEELHKAQRKPSTSTDTKDAKKKVTEAIEERKKIIRERTLDRLLPINDTNTQNRQNARKANIVVAGKQAKNAKDGLDFVVRVLDNTKHKNVPLDILTIIGTNDDRGGYYPETKTIELTILRGKIRPGSAHHECGHAVEDIVKEIWNKIERFYVGITQDSNGKREPLKNIPGYPVDEKYRKAHIALPDIYCAKEYRDNGKYDGTELLSMFMEYLFTDPYTLIAKYPEYYEGMIKCLN